MRKLRPKPGVTCPRSLSELKEIRNLTSNSRLCVCCFFPPCIIANGLLIMKAAVIPYHGGTEEKWVQGTVNSVPCYWAPSFPTLHIITAFSCFGHITCFHTSAFLYNLFLLPDIPFPHSSDWQTPTDATQSMWHLFPGAIYDSCSPTGGFFWVQRLLLLLFLKFGFHQFGGAVEKETLTLCHYWTDNWYKLLTCQLSNQTLPQISSTQTLLLER